MYRPEVYRRLSIHTPEGQRIAGGPNGPLLPNLDKKRVATGERFFVYSLPAALWIDRQCFGDPEHLLKQTGRAQ